jgi:hypothetical protein
VCAFRQEETAAGAQFVEEKQFLILYATHSQANVLTFRTKNNNKMRRHRGVAKMCRRTRALW